MDTFQLIQELANKPKHEIEFALTHMMINGQIDFLTVQHSYVEYLERLTNKKEAELIEAETCVLESLIHDKIGKKSEDEVSVQRRLYFLNHSHRYNMNGLNEKYRYDEERAKTYSHVNEIEDSLNKSKWRFYVSD